MLSSVLLGESFKKFLVLIITWTGGTLVVIFYYKLFLYYFVKFFNIFNEV